MRHDVRQHHSRKWSTITAPGTIWESCAPTPDGPVTLPLASHYRPTLKILPKFRYLSRWVASLSIPPMEKRCVSKSTGVVCTGDAPSVPLNQRNSFLSSVNPEWHYCFCQLAITRRNSGRSSTPLAGGALKRIPFERILAGLQVKGSRWNRCSPARRSHKPANGRNGRSSSTAPRVSSDVWRRVTDNMEMYRHYWEIRGYHVRLNRAGAGHVKPCPTDECKALHRECSDSL